MGITKKPNKFGLKKLTSEQIDYLKPACYNVPLLKFDKKKK
jgi:hypothetical protein